jgi:hypothetical protein
MVKIQFQIEQAYLHLFIHMHISLAAYVVMMSSYFALNYRDAKK